MRNGKIRIKTLEKFLRLCFLVRERNRLLTVDEIIQEIHCCKSHAYNYFRALKKLLPLISLDPNRPRELAQKCLIT